ncbi:hypothetical protein EBB79_08395 [Parasedimentitalea marina]|uniref:Uncharacterized protein n=1 Tax=Parasedimentitalea marina TaxID=2483033 RepID=A0A3T0N1N7_9RHOB|nr:hypothetical protein EBB79_08395 [Parasedimentitalea marina]
MKVVAEGVEEHNLREGRLSPTARGRSFDETFAESYATAPIRKATEDQRRLWLMGQETGKLNKDNGQLQLFRNFYHSDWMSERAGKRLWPDLIQRICIPVFISTSSTGLTSDLPNVGKQSGSSTLPGPRKLNAVITGSREHKRSF